MHKFTFLKTQSYSLPRAQFKNTSRFPETRLAHYTRRENVSLGINPFGSLFCRLGSCLVYVLILFDVIDLEDLFLYSSNLSVSIINPNAGRCGSAGRALWTIWSVSWCWARWPEVKFKLRFIHVVFYWYNRTVDILPWFVDNKMLSRSCQQQSCASFLEIAYRNLNVDELYVIATPTLKSNI